MTNRGRRHLRGGSSRPPPSTPDQQIGGASEDDVIMTDDGLSPQVTPSSVGGTPSSLHSRGTPSSHPSASMPIVPPVAPTGANPYPGLMFLPNGAYYRRPGFLDSPSPPERPANETRLELWSDGKTFFPHSAVKELGERMRENFHGPYLNFKSVPAPKKYIWLDMLKKSYWWPDHREADIKKCYKTIASKRLGDMVSDQKALAVRDGNKRKDWLKEEYWKNMQEDMAKPEYKARSDRVKAARAIAGLHTGGSIPTAEHFRRMCEEASKAGLDTSTINFPKIFEHTHKRKKDGKLIDERATKAFEAYEKLESHTSHAADQEGEADTSMPRTSTERNDLWVQAVGRGRGGTVYGTGSLASQPSLYSRVLPPAESTTGHAQTTTATGALTMEQLTTMMFDFQRQLRHIMELVDPPSARDGTTSAPTVPSIVAAPSVTHATASPATSPVAPPTTSVRAPVFTQSQQQAFLMLMTQFMGNMQPPSS